jgi:hypothetical protein
MFKFETLNTWGQDHASETDQEVNLLLNTIVGSVAYQRNYGIEDFENLPMLNSAYQSLTILQVLSSLEDYNTNARRERQVFSDFESIQEIEFDENERYAESEIGYYRIVDYVGE